MPVVAAILFTCVLGMNRDDTISPADVAGHIGKEVRVRFAVKESKRDVQSPWVAGYLWAEGVDSAKFLCIIDRVADENSYAERLEVVFKSWNGKQVVVQGKVERNETGRLELRATKKGAVQVIQEAKP